MRVCDFNIVCKIGIEHIKNEAHVGTEQRVKGGGPGETGLPPSSKQMIQLSITDRDDVPPLADKDGPGYGSGFYQISFSISSRCLYPCASLYWNPLRASGSQALGSHV